MTHIGVPMITVQIKCPDEILLSLKETPEEFCREITLAAAVKLYELGRLSSGRAAELAGIPRVVFLQRLAEYGVPVFTFSKNELAREISLSVR